MRRTPSAVQRAYLDDLAALAAEPAVAVPPRTAEPSGPARSVPGPVPLRARLRSAVPAWLLAAGLLLGTQQGCSIAFGHGRTGPATPSPVALDVLSLPEPPVAPAPLPSGPAGSGEAELVAGIVATLLAAGAAPAVLLLRRRRRAAPEAAPLPDAAEAEPLPDAAETAAALETPVPKVANGSWTIGFATETGQVRARNEDAGAVLCLGDARVAIVADGLGGMPEGADASALAVRAAERFLRHAWRRAGHATPAILLHGAFAAASAALACEGLRRGFTRREEGLRTTLLIAIATGAEVHFGYIGDGGMFAAGADGAVRSLMTPQKAEGEALNVVAGSLGPLAHGAPVFGTAARLPGDLLVVVSDGVADRLPPGFFGHNRGLPHYLRLCDGDLAAGAARVLSMLAREIEGGLYRFDDNMTLALIGDGDAPAQPIDIAEVA